MEHPFGPTTDFAGRYLIERELGSGGMGVVYRALDLRTDRTVALKTVLPDTMDPELIGLFLREGEILRRLRHLNIVRCYDAGVADRLLFQALEYVEGTDLASVLDDLAARGERLERDNAAGMGKSRLATMSRSNGRWR